MFTTFGVITQHFIKSTLANNNTSVLALIMFYETRADLMLTHLYYYLLIWINVLFGLMKQNNVLISLILDI